MINETPPGFEKDKKNISIDFDGVIHDWSKGWHDGTCYGEPIKGALEAIKLLSKKYQIIVFTAKCRPDRPPINGKTGKQLVIEWLKKYDLLDYISEVTHEKPRAMIYIDDKGYRFQSWNNTIKYLEGGI
tara:strand:- start:48 stop:434 length:387 start_codon:yes stop_codon:yes gene_type:complete